jgi:phosphoenolpyruvate---glycerone phosphotransferase subunit DhaL
VDYDFSTLIENVYMQINLAADELTALDAAIGDADHGVNMKRGLDAVYAERSNIGAKSVPDAMQDIGSLLLMKIGGASGPLLGTFFLALGREIKTPHARDEFARAMELAVKAVEARGKAECGQKTLIDVLAPVSKEISSANTSYEKVRLVAKSSAVATIPMLATRGRASYMGARSIGHMDPGARSCQIIIEAVCDVWEKRK